MKSKILALIIITIFIFCISFVKIYIDNNNSIQTTSVSLSNKKIDNQK